MTSSTDASTTGNTKLCVIIVPSDDGDRLMGSLASLGLGATRVGSSGGFLRRGSVTVLSAVAAERVPEIVAMLQRDFPEVVEQMPIGSLPFGDDLQPAATGLVDVRIGGAVLFVLPMEQMLRV